MSADQFQIPNFYEYLSQEGIDQSNLTDADYLNLREKYKRFRNRLYKKRQRQFQKELLIHLTHDEYKLLQLKANEHDLQIGKYIVLASLNYSKSKFLVPDKTTFKELLTSVRNIEKMIQKLADTKASSLFGNTNKYNQLVDFIKHLESKIHKGISEPVNIHQWAKNELIQNKEFRKELISLILNEQ